MRAKITRWGAILLLAAALFVIAVGCGDDGDGDAKAALPDGLTAEQIVKDSEARMATVKSGALVADLALEVQGDTEKITDPTAKALLSEGVTVHAEGSSASDPAALDMTVSLGFSGQTLEFGVLAEGDKGWVRYQDAWYALDAEDTKKGLGEQAQSGVAPTEQLKSMGIDPTSWGTQYEFVGTETLEGVDVYHVKAVADPQKLAESLSKATESPAAQEELGGSGSELGQITEGFAPDAQEVDELKKSLKEATVDYWIGVEDKLLYKAQFGASLDASSQEGMEGVSGVALKGTLAMSAFDEPVTVEAPAKAESFDKLMEQLFGGLFGGSSGLSL